MSDKIRLDDPMRHRAVREIRASITRMTGRRYEIDLLAMDLRSLRSLLRALRDIEDETRRAKQRARWEPWRRW